jgi:FERM N-terminal domain
MDNQMKSGGFFFFKNKNSNKHDEYYTKPFGVCTLSSFRALLNFSCCSNRVLQFILLSVKWLPLLVFFPKYDDFFEGLAVVTKLDFYFSQDNLPGQAILDSIFSRLNLIETAYFGVRFVDEDGQTVSSLVVLICLLLFSIFQHFSTGWIRRFGFHVS